MQMLEQISKHINTENDSYSNKKLVDSKMLIYFEKNNINQMNK